MCPSIRLPGKGSPIMNDPASPAGEQPPDAEALAALIHHAIDPGFRINIAAEEKKASSLWLVTIGDIMALMLTFFVLLYAMSSPKEAEWTRMKGALQQELGQASTKKSGARGTQDAISIDKVDFSKALDLDYLALLLRQSLKDEPLAANILVINEGDSLIVSMPESVLFEPGKADVLDGGHKTLFAMGEALSKMRNAIEIVGHADPRPKGAAPAGFSNNWDLSLARAASVAAILKSTGYAKPMTLRGMSSARYDELPESLGEEKRLDLSRRVDIVILSTTGTQVRRYSFDF
jgi:chemotaxis protein MotB